MYFAFKQEAADFIVSEELSFELSGNWDFFYIFFEKEKENTMDIILWICKEMKLKRENIGISGLKDKIWITRQWLSISKKYLNRCGGETIFLNFLRQRVEILKTAWHNGPLAVGKNKGNHFEIRLRKREELPDEKKQTLELKLEKSKKIWFPNAFGIQRFGKGNKNFKKAKILFDEWIKKGNYEVKFKLQAFGSMWFNEYVMKRWEENAFLLEGDIMVNGWNAFWNWIAIYQWEKLHHFDYRKEKSLNEKSDFWRAKDLLRSSDHNPKLWYPTGPVLGSEQLLCPLKSKAEEYDQRIIKESGFQKKGSQISSLYKLYGFRRPLRWYPEFLSWKRKWGDLLLTFFLPTGNYASVFLAEILKDIDPQWCISNWLIIPRTALK